MTATPVTNKKLPRCSRPTVRTSIGRIARVATGSVHLIFFSNNFDVYALVNTCRLFWVVRCFGTNSGQFRKPLERCYLSLHSREASLMADNFLVYQRIESQFESFDRALNDLFQVFWVNFDPVKRWAGIRRVWWDYVSDSGYYWGF